MPTIRPATDADVPAMQALIELSAMELSEGFYDHAQAEALTREVFGVDSQLVADGTYFVVEKDSRIVACGGWSKRVTPFGGDQHKRGVDRLLDPATEAARIRAFFVDPRYARQGIGMALLRHCAGEAAREGFATLELTSTMPGEPLYRAAGFEVVERFELPLAGGTVHAPLALMRRSALF